MAWGFFMGSLNRAIGRLRSGQQLEDLPGNLLWVLLLFYESVDSPQQECIHAEISRRCSASEHSGA
jgi:hypothetical protein